MIHPGCTLENIFHSFFSTGKQVENSCQWYSQVHDRYSRSRLKNAGVFIATVLPAPTQRHDFLDEVNMPPTLTTYSTRLTKGKTTPKQRGRVSQGRPAPLTTATLRYTALRGLRLSPNSCRACRLRTQPAEPNTGQDEDVRRAGTRCRISAGKVLAAGQTVTERAPAGTHGTQGSTKAGPVLTARSCTSFSSKEYSSATIQSF